MKKTKHDEKGKFLSPYREPRGRALAFRLPATLDEEFFDYVGDRPYKPIIEQAIREYLDRHA